MFDKKQHSLFFLIPFVQEDECAVYRRMLRESKKRQQERDEMAMAWIDNLFHGEEYQSIFEENPALLEFLPKKLRDKFKQEIATLGHPKHDAGMVEY